MVGRWLARGVLGLAFLAPLACDGRGADERAKLKLQQQLQPPDPGVWGPASFELKPYDRYDQSFPCVAGRESRALVIGNGLSAVGIYVYDPRGNCVALDDAPSPVFDDRIVAWTPAVSAPYSIEFRNLGFGSNDAEASAK